MRLGSLFGYKDQFLDHIIGQMIGSKYPNQIFSLYIWDMWVKFIFDSLYVCDMCFWFSCIWYMCYDSLYIYDMY